MIYVCSFDGRRLEHELDTSSDPYKLREILVSVVKRASGNPAYNWGINGNVLSTLMSPVGKIQSVYYGTNDQIRAYAPLTLWYNAGRNYCAGDAWFLSSDGSTFQLGPSIFVETPILDKQSKNINMEIHFRAVDAKYKRDKIQDAPLITGFRNNPFIQK